ncbi:cytochrome P450 [Hyaloraphidium curvatum]|nr:cytochrome P450 [Hyaloraphidium curvatum]
MGLADLLADAVPLTAILLSALVLIAAAALGALLVGVAPASPAIPGPKRKDASLGNLPDMAAAGSLHEYLEKLHAAHGSVARFAFGRQDVASLADPRDWKKIAGLFDRPPLLFALFEDMIGRGSIQYANGAEGKRRRKETFDPPLSHAAVAAHFPTMRVIAGSMVARFEEAVDAADPAPAEVAIKEHCDRAALESICTAAFGTLPSPEQVDDIAKAYGVCWDEMRLRLGGDVPGPDDPRTRAHEKALATLRSHAEGFLDSASVDEDASKAKPDRGTRVGDVVTTAADKDASFPSLLRKAGLDRETCVGDVVTMLVGGFHTSANLLIWAFYLLARHAEAQSALAADIRAAGGPGIPIDALLALPRLSATIDETLRWSALAPFAARVSRSPITVGPYTIPAGTPIVQPLGLALHSPTSFPDPGRFDPGRFLGPAQHPPAAFSPFGFAGGRVCPGARYARAEAAAVLAAVVDAFVLEEAGEVGKEYGLVTAPDREVVVRMRRRA